MKGKSRVGLGKFIFFFLALSLVFYGNHLYGKSSLDSRWSKTRPEINLVHIFEGEINSRNRPVGFHARPGGLDPEFARMIRVKAKANNMGVYTAEVEIFDKKEKEWKRKFSSFFPDNMSRQEVIETILYAYDHRSEGKGTKWQGPSGKGFMVHGYLNRRGNINTAYPIYVKTR